MVSRQFGVWTARGAMLAGTVLLGGCSSSIITGVYGSSPPEEATPTQTAAGQPQQPARVDFDPDLECPVINIPTGSSSFGTPNGSQFSISNFARECNLSGPASVTIKIGIEGHVVLAGSGGGSYSAPIRITVRDRDEKAIYSRVVRVSASVPAGAGQGAFRVVQTTDPIPIGVEKPLNTYDIVLAFDGKGGAAPTARKKRRS